MCSSFTGQRKSERGIPEGHVVQQAAWNLRARGVFQRRMIGGDPAVEGNLQHLRRQLPRLHVAGVSRQLDGTDAHRQRVQRGVVLHLDAPSGGHAHMRMVHALHLRHVVLLGKSDGGEQ
jgi:hypothetical protein